MDSSSDIPHLALLGCGIFARDAYLPILKNLKDRLSLRFVWSRSEDSAKRMLAKVHEFSPEAEARWGEDGMEGILSSPQVDGCAIVLPILSQPRIVLKALRAGKHVLQEKPIAGSKWHWLSKWLNEQRARNSLLWASSCLHNISPLGLVPTDVKEALETLRTIATELKVVKAQVPIWAVAENFRFEPAFYEAAEMIKELGNMVVVQVNIEIPMNPSSKYFLSEWRREPVLKGGFITDCGVHFVAGLRTMLGGCNITSISAIATHRDTSVPPPDTLTTLLTLENGCSGVMVITYSSSNNKSSWRVVCSRGAVEVERGLFDGKLGYTVKLVPLEGKSTSKFFSVQGLQEELKVFANDIKKTGIQGGHRPDSRSSPAEALQDLAIVETALSSGSHKDAPVAMQPLIISDSMWTSDS